MQTPLSPDAPLTLSELESHLWEAANILRGSPLDRTDWKSYSLPLLFFKRLCDVSDEEAAEARQLYGQDFSDEHRFQIPDGCHWNDVRATPANVGAALQHALRGVEAANQKHLGAGLAACILVLRRRKPAPRAGKVLSVDAAALFRKGRAQNFLDPEHAKPSWAGCRPSPMRRTGRG